MYHLFRTVLRSQVILLTLLSGFAAASKGLCDHVQRNLRQGPL